ncbi:LAQU0S14e01728g1_1 [Lachancea quebecensis]|uniref:Pheromone-processing carboxypeptidase KEX1 n=1 Tax=Lachancea quebecensis TaxID=1654605 RepID=A0A0P1KW40_9SACH|nr:LAQU0S14e01728g1_1 [Lachancea quebecensis]
MFSNYSVPLALLCALLLSFQTARALKAADDYAVSPDLIPGLSQVEDRALIPAMHAGHIPLDENNDEHTKNYFFWKFHDESGSASGPARDTLIFWLNGGPGCSSMDGALMESGALRIDSDGKAYLNRGGWHTRGDIVFVDQPAGTGFSTVASDDNYDNDLKVVSEHFVAFLRNYFQVFPDDAGKQVVFAGESYAGQFIPYFARAVLSQNEVEVNLHALLIGNGWIDPNQQSLYYIPFAVEKGLITQDDPNFSYLLKQQESCQNKINSKENDRFSFKECENILNNLLEVTRKTKDSDGKKVPSNQQCINMYDLRLKDSYPSCGMNWPEDLPNLGKFFGTEGVLEALHLDPEHVSQWHECDDKVSNYLKNPDSRPSAAIIPELLEAGLEVMLFNGDQDIICNNMGVEAVISQMSWGGETGFSENMQYYDWVYRTAENSETIPAGFVKYDRNLTFMSVFNASHMVPFDNALVSRGVVDLFLNDVDLIQINGRDTLITDDINKGNDEEVSETNDVAELDCEGKDKLSEECKQRSATKGQDGESGEEGEEEEDDEKDEDDKEEDDKDEDDKDEDDKDEDDKDEDDKDEDDKHDDDDSDDDEKNDDKPEGKDGKNVENKDDDDDDDDDRNNGSHLAVTIICLLVSGTIIGGLYFTFRDRFRPKLRAILIDPTSRSEANKKTVSWAADLEQDAADLSNPEPGAKKKGPYTSVPAQGSRDSFELDNL